MGFISYVCARLILVPGWVSSVWLNLYLVQLCSCGAVRLAFVLYALFLNLCNWLGRAAYVATLLLYVLGRYVLAAYLGMYNCFFIACHCSLVWDRSLCFAQFFCYRSTCIWDTGWPCCCFVSVFLLPEAAVLFQVVCCRKPLLWLLLGR